MRSDFELLPLTPEERRREVARVLAAGVRRLLSRSSLAVLGEQQPAVKKPGNSGENDLEVPPEVRLNVHPG